MAECIDNSYDKMSITHATSEVIEASKPILDNYELVADDNNLNVLYKGCNGNLIPISNRFKSMTDVITTDWLNVGTIVELEGYHEGIRAPHKRVIEESDDGSGVQLDNDKWANIVYNEIVDLKWFGAKGDGATNDTLAIQKAISYNNIVFSSGEYVITDTINIIGKNLERYDSFKLFFNPETIIKCDFGDTKPVFLISQCVNINIDGLQTKSSDFTNIINYIEFDGVWKSTFSNCVFENVKINPRTTTNYYKNFYWNEITKCEMRSLYLSTGTDENPTEINSNSFANCKMHGDGVTNIYLTGKHKLQSLSFYSCDISGATGAFIDINSDNDGGMDFYGCYIDGTENTGKPFDTGSFTLNFYGSTELPYGASVTDCTVYGASNTYISSSNNIRAGSRIPTSGENLIINGDLSADEKGITGLDGSFCTYSIESGIMGKKLIISSSGGNSYITFDKILTNANGIYGISVVSKVILGNPSVIINVDGDNFYGAINTNTSITFDTYSHKINSSLGVVFIVNDGDTIEVEYVGCNFGKFSQLFLPLADLANLNLNVTKTGYKSCLNVNPVIGEKYYNLSNSTLMLFNGIDWVNTDGFIINDLDANDYIGKSKFDITLNKPVWYNGTDWVDASGTVV